MARGFSVSVTIDRPAAEVWAVMTDFERAPRWMNGIDSMRLAGDGPAGEGSAISFTARRAERHSRIAAWSPPAHLALVSEQGGITAFYDYRLTPQGAATEVSLDASCAARGLLWRLAHPLIVLAMRHADSGQLAKLKSVLETRDG